MEPQSSQRLNYEQIGFFIYTLAVLAAISAWFVAVRSPLWLDETASYWSISGGFRQIWARSIEINSFPAYFYILWLTNAIFGSKEIVLRVPSILAMLGAVYLLYLAARELFDGDKEIAIITAVIFCVHPIVIFAAIDVRPYAFAALAINASILALVRLRRNNSNWLAAVFGLLAACIAYFHLLFTVILPALAICFIAAKIDDRKALWRQGGVAVAVFALAFLPLIPISQYLFHTTGNHVFAETPKLRDLLLTLAPWRMGYIFGGAVLVAAATRRLDLQGRFEVWRFLLCVSLALVPIFILYGVSVETTVHVFLRRYRLIAIPGTALCWAWLVSWIESRPLRLLFSVAVVASVAYAYFIFPPFRYHANTWKDALESVEKNASADNAPVLICSDVVEADHTPIPVGEAVKDSVLFAPLTYYKLSVPVVGLPRALNDEAIRIGSSFLKDTALRRERFLAIGYAPSDQTLQWLIYNAAATHDVRAVGVFDGIVVLEFIPRAQADAGR